MLRPEQWKQPLPDRIQFNVNHSDDVSDIVGSGEPWIDDAGNLRVTGKYADTEQGQHIRALVNGEHLTGVSVEFLRIKGVRELRASAASRHDLSVGVLRAVGAHGLTNCQRRLPRRETRTLRQRPGNVRLQAPTVG